MCELHKRGIATAVICSEPFLRLAKAQAAVGGVPDLSLILIPHPLGGTSLDVVKSRAQIAHQQLSQVIRELQR
jgi:hypothetical protein